MSKKSNTEYELEEYRSQLRRWLDGCWIPSQNSFMLNPTLATETKALLDKWKVKWEPNDE